MNIIDETNSKTLMDIANNLERLAAAVEQNNVISLAANLYGVHTHKNHAYIDKDIMIKITKQLKKVSKEINKQDKE